MGLLTASTATGRRRRGAEAFVVMTALAAMALAACGGSSSTSSLSTAAATEAAASSAAPVASGAETTLNMLTWQGYHDQAWLDECQQKTGVTVNAVNVGSPDEMFAKLKASPDQWDLVLATSGWFNKYVQENLLFPIEESKVTALSTMKLGFPWKDATTVDGKNYGVLYNWGDQALAWIPDAMPTDASLKQYEGADGNPNDWNILWDPAFKGKVSVFDDPTSVLPMIALAAGVKDPYNWSEADYAAVKAKLNALRPQLKRLTSGYDDQTNQFATGEAILGYLNIQSVVGGVAQAGKMMQLNHEVKQTTPAWSDNYAITQAGAEKGQAVYDFINCTMELTYQARFIATSLNSGILDYDQATSADAVAAGLTEDKLKDTMIPATQGGEAFFKSMNFFKTVEDIQKRIDLWNEFKLGLGG